MTQIRSILLAEDDEDDRMIFQEIINKLKEEREIHFETVENGLDLVQLLNDRPQQTLPSLIILDQNMPKMNGQQTLVALKADERYLHIPVVIYSTHNDSRLTDECIRTGAEQIITKPDSFDGFSDMIVQLAATYLPA